MTSFMRTALCVLVSFAISTKALPHAEADAHPDPAPFLTDYMPQQSAALWPETTTTAARTTSSAAGIVSFLSGFFDLQDPPKLTSAPVGLLSALSSLLDPEDDPRGTAMPDRPWNRQKPSPATMTSITVVSTPTAAPPPAAAAPSAAATGRPSPAFLPKGPLGALIGGFESIFAKKPSSSTVPVASASPAPAWIPFPGSETPSVPSSPPPAWNPNLASMGPIPTITVPVGPLAAPATTTQADPLTAPISVTVGLPSSLSSTSTRLSTLSPPSSATPWPKPYTPPSLPGAPMWQGAQGRIS